MQEIIWIKRRNVKHVELVFSLLYLGVDEGLHSEKLVGFLFHQLQVRHDVGVSDSSWRTEQVVHRCTVAVDLIKQVAYSYINTHKTGRKKNYSIYVLRIL